MMRLLYRFLLLLHPPEFRQRFEAEMLCSFDDFGGGSLFLLTDAVSSLARQWVMRRILWIYVGAVAGALLTLYIPFNAGRPPLTHVRSTGNPAQALFFIYAAASVQAIGLTTVFSVALFRFTLRRGHS